MSASFGRISQLKPAPDAVTYLWLLGSLALAIVPHLGRLPVWLPVLFVAMAIERGSHFLIRRKPIGGWLRLLLTAVCLFAIFQSFPARFGREAAVALLCTMLALKLSETFKKRDVFLLITLAYFVVVTQFLFSQTVYLAVYLVLVVVVITATLIINELQPSRQLHATDPVYFSGHTLRSAGLMLLQGLPLMLLLFVLFPRLSAPIWGVPEDALYGRTGISDRMEPGSIRELFVDDSPAFRVEFFDPVPSQDALYWRGPVLWHFDGAVWCRRAPCTADDRRETPLIGRIGAIEGATSRPVRYEVTIEPTQQHWLVALDTPVRRPGGWMGLERDYTMHRIRPLSRLFTYEMTSDTGYLKNSRWDLWLRDAGLQLPEDRNPRTRALALELRERHGTNDRAIVVEVLSRFRNEDYAYSFTPPPLGYHTVDDFLFTTREGYCEFYASAFTFLMRAAGIPARVVTGYQGGDYNNDSEYLLVRYSDAHAWSEVWLDDAGWVRVDPTAAVAPERVDLGAREAVGQRRSWYDFPWVRGLQNRFDAVSRVWTNWVLKFDQSRQQSLFRPLGLDQLSSKTAVVLLAVLGSGFVGFVMWLLLRAQWLGGLDPIAREYARFCRKLARRGVTRLPWEGPQDFALRAAAALEPARGAIERITQLYVGLRYRPQAAADDLKQLRRAVRTLRLSK